MRAMFVPVFAADSAARRTSWIIETALRFERRLASVARALYAERQRWVLWLPVIEACGIGAYFSRTAEPSWWPGIVALGGGALGWTLLSRDRSAIGWRRLIAMLSLILAIASAGWLCAQWQTARVAGPLLTQPTPPLRIEGKVGDISILPQGCRIELVAPVIEAISPVETPKRLRLKTKTCPGAIGSIVRGRALMFPEPSPMFPGGYDFQRQTFFQGVGGTGFVLGSLYEIAPPVAQGGDLVLDLRHSMTARIMATLPGAKGGIAAALITGEKAGIPPDVAQEFRDSGLAHMLVIAGLHMSLVAGFVFFITRAVLALVPWLALRYPIKKAAAVASLAAATAYLVISGGAVPTERAFMMCCLGILAILFDRAVFSMRGLALAAVFILTENPVALMGVSFQMSFAAVVALIAFYESFAIHLSRLRAGSGVVRRFAFDLLGIALTTLIATIGTIPFTIYHFGRFALYSVLANVIAVPLAGIWILPWAFSACLLMPFHLEALALVPMGWGIGIVETVAGWTAGLPKDVVILPAMPDFALLAISLGGLWFCLWRGEWRSWGVVPIIAGFLAIPLVRPPDIFVAPDGRLVAVRGNDGRLYLSSSRRERMTAESWETAAGVDQTPELPETGIVASRQGNWTCTPNRCTWGSGSNLVVIVRSRLNENIICPEGRLVIALYALPDRCRMGKNVIDPTLEAASGAQTVWLGDPLRVRGTGIERGTRPWIPVSNDASNRRDDPAP